MMSVMSERPSITERVWDKKNSFVFTSSFVCVCEWVCVFLCVSLCVYVCLCVCEQEREAKRGKERERKIAYALCVCVNTSIYFWKVANWKNESTFLTYNADKEIMKKISIFY